MKGPAPLSRQEGLGWFAPLLERSIPIATMVPGRVGPHQPGTGVLLFVKNARAQATPEWGKAQPGESMSGEGRGGKNTHLAYVCVQDDTGCTLAK